VVPQVGTYTFHGAAGNQKILKVRTVNNESLEDLFGAGWVGVIESFGVGAANVGAEYKSVVNGVNFTGKYDATFYGLGVIDSTWYNTSNWFWTTGAFNNTPDSTNVIVNSFYDPADVVNYSNAFWDFWLATPYNVSMHTIGIFLSQLPTPVAQYLGALVWEPKWENIGNTIVHHAVSGDWNVPLYTFQYLENCTEIWTYDETYGAFIGYKILNATNTVIYEFSIELPGAPEIPGYELPIIIGVTSLGIISLIFIIMKKKR
jgi:hypothetical protein